MYRAAYRASLVIIVLLGTTYAKNAEDYKIDMTVLVTNYDGSFTHNCAMTVKDGESTYNISSNGVCYTFRPKTRLKARKSSFLGVPMIEFGWTNDKGKFKTAKYRIDSEY